MFFLLIPVGAAIGLITGGLLTRDSPSVDLKGRLQTSKGALPWTSRKLKQIADMLTNDTLLIRLGSLMSVGCALFILAWLVGYILLPEGAFSAGAQAHMTRGSLGSASQSVVEEWTKILRANLIPISLIIFGSMLIKVNGIPLGYLVALYNLTLYGLFVGTNSFAIPYAERMAPSFAILGRSGPYEMAALVLLAAAAFPWSFFEVKRLFQTAPERVMPGPKFRLAELMAVILGVGLMMAANWVEASMILQQLP